MDKTKTYTSKELTLTVKNCPVLDFSPILAGVIDKILMNLAKEFNRNAKTNK